MNFLLFFAILSQNQTDIDNFVSNTAPHLNYLINGTEILSDTKQIGFGIEAIYSDYNLIYDDVSRVPSFNGYITIKRGSFMPYIKFGFYPKTSNTDKTAPFLSIGFNFLPKFSNALTFRVSYGTSGSIDFYLQGDPYYNYDYQSIHCLNLSLVGFKKLSVFTPFFTAGLLPSYVSGKFRNDINQIEENFSKFNFGWHLGLGFKIFFAKINAELVNSRLSASTSFNL